MIIVFATRNNTLMLVVDTSIVMVPMVTQTSNGYSGVAFSEIIEGKILEGITVC